MAAWSSYHPCASIRIVSPGAKATLSAPVAFRILEVTTRASGTIVTRRVPASPVTAEPVLPMPSLAFT